MIDRVFVGFFVLAALALLSVRVQNKLRGWLLASPARFFLAPSLLAALFLLFLLSHKTPGPALALVVLVYISLPALLTFGGGRGRPGSGWDAAALLVLWLPLEFGLGASLIPRPLQGPVHTVAYGVAVTLALSIFLLLRDTPGMKYEFPARLRDAVWLAGVLALLVPALVVLGRALSFIDPFHIPAGLRAAGLAGRFALIFLATALPEEILFRSLIQNWIGQRLGENLRSLLLAAVIFGAAHFNNPPGPLPNWRYALLATVAGLGYGIVFRKTTSVLWSAALHASVNTLRHTFFQTP